MADIAKLVDAALRKRRELAAHVGPGLVIIKTIEAQGIRDQASIGRLKKELKAELNRRGISLVKTRPGH